jgi:protein O-mannosyl-transferase
MSLANHETTAEGRRRGSCWAGRLLVGLLLAIVWLVFRRVVGFQFLSWDDNVHVTENPYLDPLSWPNLLRFWQEPYENLYIPLSYSFWAFEAWLSQHLPGRVGPFDPAVFHAGNLVLHAACVLLMFRLLLRLIQHRLAAWAGALLFAIHPLQVESVAWVGETRGLLAALFSLLALDQYARFVADELNAERSASNGRWNRPYAWASLAFAAAMLSKPSAAALPLMAAVLDACWFGRPLRKIVLSLGPWLVAAAALIAITKLQQSDTRLAFVPPLWARPLIAADALDFYLYKLLVPLRLGFDYGRSPEMVLHSGPMVYLAWLVPVVLAGLMTWSKDRAAWLAAAGLFVAALLPTLGFVPFFYQAISTVADRYMYLPMLGASLGLAWWLARHWSTAMFAACCFLLGALARVAAMQATFWQDDLALFDRGLEINPSSYMAEDALGAVFQKQGKLPEARHHYEQALRINDHYAPAHNDLGATLFLLGRTGTAIDHYRAALQLWPDYAEAHSNLGNALEAQGQPAAAIAEYEAALAIKPTLADAHMNLGETLARRGRTDAALEHLRRAVQIKPQSADAHFKLAQVLMGSQNEAEAEREFHEALRCDAKLAAAHNNLGAMYWNEHRLPEADREYQAALAIDPTLIEARFNQGCILIELGQPARGLERFRQALDLVPAESPQAAYIRGEIKKYESLSGESPDLPPQK